MSDEKTSDLMAALKASLAAQDAEMDKAIEQAEADLAEWDRKYGGTTS